MWYCRLAFADFVHEKKYSYDYRGQYPLCMFHVNALDGMSAGGMFDFRAKQHRMGAMAASVCGHAFFYFQSAYMFWPLYMSVKIPEQR